MNDRVIMNNGLGQMWTETVVAFSKILSQQFHGGMKENYRKTSAKASGLWANI